MFTDIMLDLETWGLTPGSAIRSIGGRMFDIDRLTAPEAIYSQVPMAKAVSGGNRFILSKEGHNLLIPNFSNERSFYCNVHRESCVGWGLTVDPETEKWWNDQSPEARAALEHEQIELVVAVDAFNTWLEQNANPKIRIWSNGAGFDVPVIEAAMRACGSRKPYWEYYNVRDTRTLKHMAFAQNVADAAWPKQFQRGAHHALFDADYQAFEAQQFWHIVNRGWLGRLLAAFKF